MPICFVNTASGVTRVRYICRMHGKKAKEHKEARKELDQSISLVKAPTVLKEDPSLTLPKIKVKVVPSQAEQNQPMEE